MYGTTEILILVGTLLVLVFSGVHIAISLGLTSMLGLFLLTGDPQAMMSFAANTAYEALRDYIFAVIPLFMLMGEFLARCGAASDLFALINRTTRRIPGRLGVATVLANGVFAFVSGVSIAAAAAFSKIAYPEMRRYGYDRKLALGTIAGSACLGMLIPPSVLMIVWGVLTEISIGKLFIAGVLPGLMVVTLFIGYIVWVARTQPHRVGEGRGAAGALPPNMQLAQQPAAIEALRRAQPLPVDLTTEADLRKILISTFGIIALVVTVLGGIWFGFFTPTEGAGVGATLALILALTRGMRMKEMIQAVISVGRTSAPLLLLLVTAQLYSRVLSMTGLTGMAKDFFASSGLSPYMVLALMILVWFILGALIDSISIILLTVPVFAPVAAAVGFDPLAFAIIGILAIETGLLTPPFGILVFTVKAAVPDEPGLTNAEIFRGAIPYWIALLSSIIFLVLFPQLATWLPNLGQ